MEVLKKLLVLFVLPFAVIFIISRINGLAGAAGVLLYITIMLFKARIRIFAWLGNVNYVRGNMDKAASWLDKAYKTGKAKPIYAASYAYLLLKMGKINEADKILALLINSNISFEDKMFAKSNYALVLWKQNKLDEALKLLEEVFEGYKNTTIYGSLGFFYILKGDLDKALAFNIEAYDYNSSNTVILDNLGQTYYLREEYDKAAEIYGKLIPTEPSFPEAYYNYGLVLLKRNENEDALKFFKKALDYKFTYLSTVSREQVEAQIRELESRAS